jgi:2-polyprenyl-3-methyl-5-hydroxy-6-metoxy-1,4-benzoquinol methylase
MPSSFVDSVPSIVHLLIRRAPGRVVDIGPGWGKYGLLCREYLHNIDWLDAVEVSEGRKATQDPIYDDVHVSDVRLFKYWRCYDLALMIDVIEHMDHEDGHQILQKVLGDGCSVLVSTPKAFVEQSDARNPYETHVSLWTGEDFERYEIEEDASTIDSIIYLLSGTRSEC